MWACANEWVNEWMCLWFHFIWARYKMEQMQTNSSVIASMCTLELLVWRRMNALKHTTFVIVFVFLYFIYVRFATTLMESENRKTKFKKTLTYTHTCLWVQMLFCLACIFVCNFCTHMKSRSSVHVYEMCLICNADKWKMKCTCNFSSFKIEYWHWNIVCVCAYVYRLNEHAPLNCPFMRKFMSSIEIKGELSLFTYRVFKEVVRFWNECLIKWTRECV